MTVSRVNKIWKSLVDNHASLLTHIDLSDPTLSNILTTSHVCQIITRSGIRLQSLHVWHHTQTTSRYPSSDWNMLTILDSIIAIHHRSTSSTSGMSLKLLTFFGHQELDQITAMLPSIIACRPCTLEFATCFDLPDIELEIVRTIMAADAVGTKPSPITMTSTGGSGLMIKKESYAIELKFRQLVYGHYVCSGQCAFIPPLGSDLDNNGWYRQCISCFCMYCISCVTHDWQWSNDFQSKSRDQCVCSLCPPRRLHRHDVRNKDDSIVVVRDGSSLLCQTHCDRCHLAAPFDETLLPPLRRKNH
jgi:hypothetical protein